MKKIGKALRGIGMLIRNPWLLNRVIDDNTGWRKRVMRIHGTDSLPVVVADRLFGERSAIVEPYAFMEGGSLPTDLMLLRELASGIPSCRYFEIGTWRGESVANVAAVAEHCVTLDLPASVLLRSGKPDDYISQQRLFSRGLDNVTHLEGNSATFDYDSLDGPFDLIFIDGDHHYESILEDTRKVFSHLLHEDSIVVWHDYAYNPAEVRYETLCAILDALPSEKHGHLYHFGNSLCAFYHPRDLTDMSMPLTTKAGLTFSLRIKY